MSEEINVYGDDFRPPGAGRPPVADISKITYAAAQNPGMWVSQVFTNREANSAMGQLKRRGYEASSAQLDVDHREVYVMYGKTQ